MKEIVRSTWIPIGVTEGWGGLSEVCYREGWGGDIKKAIGGGGGVRVLHDGGIKI